jgi:uncharacterized RDD family membrane protein YckC
MAIYKFAGFWRRSVAYGVDNLIISIVFLILVIIISTAFIVSSLSGNTSTGTLITDLVNPAHLTSIALLAGAFYIVISIVYFTYFHGIKGRTPGKMLLSLQVLSAEGTPIGFGIAFLRAVGYLVSSLLFTFPLGFIWAAFDRRKQGWHDKIAGTVVIIRPDENETEGLNIPEQQASCAIPQTIERQNKTVFQSPVQPAAPAVGENEAIANQTGVNDQKIP